MAASYKLTNGDLFGMDATDLREHAVAYLAANGEDEYVWSIASHLALLADLQGEEVMKDLRLDVLLSD